MKAHHNKALDRLRNREDDLRRLLDKLRGHPLKKYADILAFQADYAIRFYETLKWEAAYVTRFINHLTETELTEDEITWRCMLLARRFGARNVTPDSFHSGKFRHIDEARAFSTFDPALVNSIDPRQLDYLIGFSEAPPVAEDKKRMAEAIAKFRVFMDWVREVTTKTPEERKEKAKDKTKKKPPQPEASGFEDLGNKAVYSGSAGEVVVGFVET
jgi:hypothetical protein